MAKVTKRSFQKITASEIGKMKAPELRNLLRGVRQLYNAQSKTFQEHERMVYSPAYEKMEQFYEDRGAKAPSRMNINQMRQEIFRLQEFFDSKTATVPGARKVQTDQDRRIFGVDKRGRPKYRMSTSQRKTFWALFEEYKNLRPADVYEQSNIVQQALGQTMVESRGLDFDADTLERLAHRVAELRHKSHREMDGDYDEDGSVFSGRRPY